MSVYDSSSHEKTRAIVPIGGDLSIRLDFRDISSPETSDRSKVLQVFIKFNSRQSERKRELKPTMTSPWLC